MKISSEFLHKHANFAHEKNNFSLVYFSLQMIKHSFVQYLSDCVLIKETAELLRESFSFDVSELAVVSLELVSSVDVWFVFDITAVESTLERVKLESKEVLIG